MATVREIAEQIIPAETVLFLGAGASVSSGGPSGTSLATKLWRRLAKNDECPSQDLTEVASILENRYGRKLLIEAVRKELQRLEPSGEVLSIPEYPWHRIYSTNYDTLIERSYKQCNKPLVVIRSNFDYGRGESPTDTELLKIHGCLTQDIADGARAGMALTERDIDEHAEYRETLFSKLADDLARRNVLVLGASLRDPHIQREMKKVAELHNKKGASGRLFAILYERDPDRGALMERRGFTIAYGTIAELFTILASSKPTTSAEGEHIKTDEFVQLPPRLRASTLEFSQQRGLAPSASRLFNGSPASYADINAGLTFARHVEKDLIHRFLGEKNFILSITGAAGVGKTTMARRIVSQVATEHGMYAWEHWNDFQLQPDSWIEVERILRERSKQGILVIDDCHAMMGAVNRLCSAFAKHDSPALRLVLTAATAQWVPRIKAREIFSRGVSTQIRSLQKNEIEHLVTLTESQPAIRSLVDSRFLQLSRSDKTRRLWERCSSDMYVCLKNIFASEHLDTILLREYATLSEEQQGVYRHVAALEAAGAHVHRQLIIRTLGIMAHQIQGMLPQLEGLVDEYTVSEKEGIFRWQTRHDLIAQTIARYKFADQDELFSLLSNTIENINPLIELELRTLRDLCNSEYGIYRLTDPERQLDLYERLIQLAPGERTPRHRLIKKLMQLGRLEEAEQALRQAEAIAGFTSPLNSFKVQLAIKRATSTDGILPEDRMAMLRDAERIALRGLERLGERADKNAFIVYLEVGLAIADYNHDTAVLDDAIARARAAADNILDPQLFKEIRDAERQRKGWP